MLGRVKEVCEGEDGMERGNPHGSGQKCLPGEAEASLGAQGFGAMYRVFLEPAPSVGPP